MGYSLITRLLLGSLTEPILSKIRYGHGIFPDAGDSFCNLGTEDAFPTDPGSEAFVVGNIRSRTAKFLNVTEFDTTNYSQKETHGYMCQTEDFWGCPTGYYLHQTECYRVFFEEVTYPEAEVACRVHGGILALPHSFMQSEFLESLVDYSEIKYSYNASSIWIGHRLENVSDTGFFDILLGRSHQTPSDIDGDCIVITKVDGKHTGWNTTDCGLTQANYICQLSHTLAAVHQPYVPKPKAVIPLARDSGPKAFAKIIIISTESNMAYDTRWVPSNLLGSAIFTKFLEGKSYVEVNLAEIFAVKSKKLTIMMWIMPYEATPLPALHSESRDSLGQEKKMTLKVGSVVQLELSDDAKSSTIEVTESLVDNPLNLNEWNFIAVSLNMDIFENTFVVNDVVGYDTEEYGYFVSNNTDVLEQMFQVPIRIGAINDTGYGAAFDGRISCVQIYDEAFNPATIFSKKYCPDAPESLHAPACPDGLIAYEDQCFKIQTEPKLLGEAEASCLPEEDAPYKSQLMWADNPKILHHFVHMVKEKSGLDLIYVGLSDFEGDGSFTDSFGANLTASQSLLFHPDKGRGWEVGMAHIEDNGYLSTKDLIEPFPYVCSSTSRVEEPDNECPKGFYPYRGKCLYPNATQLTYDDAMAACAERGSIVLPIKDKGMHVFIGAWAEAMIGADIWVGLRNKRLIQVYDDFPLLVTSLQEDKYKDLTYTDGESFVIGESYALGTSVLDQECFYLRQSSSYEMRGGICERGRGFICEWKKPNCPDGYEHIPRLSDGRTCHAILMNYPKPFEHSTCDGNIDMLREKWTPKTSTEMELFMAAKMVNEPIWGSLSMDGLGNWHRTLDDHDIDETNEDEEIVEPLLTKNYYDMRLITSGAWEPPESVLNDNGTTFGCMQLLPSGLYYPKIDDDCNISKKQACTYKACMTVDGRQCIFPFLFGNDTYPYMEYKICSALDIHRPWCPTMLNIDRSIAEWGECLPDCPSDEYSPVCYDDPEPPSFSDGHGGTVNFTTNHPMEVGKVTAEFDYVAFTCPPGYAYKGSMNTTHFALCFDWEFHYLFDPSTVCSPVICPDVLKFHYGTPKGKRILYVADEESPTYGDMVTYTCPEGYVFNPEELYPRHNNTKELNVTCATYGDWIPSQLPVCVPINCTDDPIKTPNSVRGTLDWDQTIRNRSFTFSIRYYCPLKEWGYPSTGHSENMNECQSDGKWSLTYQEECVKLPCPESPPNKTEGGWRWYHPQRTRFKCPNGFVYEEAEYPIFMSNCTPKGWNPPIVVDCEPRQCTYEPPLKYLNMDMDWPFRNRSNGATVSYHCPWRIGTWEEKLKTQYVTCIWDRATDEMIWWPPDIVECDPCTDHDFGKQMYDGGSDI